MTLPARLSGVIPPVCTPLTPAGEVDTVSLARLVDQLAGAGVDGLFVLGSTSEAAFLTDRQRVAVVDTVVGQLNGALPVLAGAIDMTTPRVVEHARAALAAGADAVVATAPFYTRVARPEIERHYRLLADRVEAPVFAYDLPVATGVKLPAALVLALAADGVLAGLKDSSPELGELRAVLAGVQDGVTGPDFAVLTGSELVVDAALLMGAHGVVPGLGNVDPHGYVRLVAACAERDWARARVEQDRLARLFALVEAGDPGRMGRGSAAIGGFKTALYLRGWIDHPTTAEPQVPLNEAETERVAKHLAGAGLL
ncbi:dihydrodipicolinate synthase family protein [Streptomyces sp. DSM 44915]|uniref:Dihydrodipicolinate synthase family protein n=1 Tax=Streptomyces chisholmiae TaxID=3075540 RepID=A0ABU2JRU7_9ACTN|nr:dihydrodipicolinate synthase family protein [Streptomyces sp. DSM 44915]MDT0267719.1 dihydrodipicolinate synthase family protein [Streptomyces sp. DSM 44915]